MLSDYRSMEPMLLCGHRREHTRAPVRPPELDAFPLSNAFTWLPEAQRGDAVHRREQARFLLDIEQQPAQALLTPRRENWRVQREPDDVLILLHRSMPPRHIDPTWGRRAVLEFLRQAQLEDARNQTVPPRTLEMKRVCRRHPDPVDVGRDGCGTHFQQRFPGPPRWGATASIMVR